MVEKDGSIESNEEAQRIGREMAEKASKKLKLKLPEVMAKDELSPEEEISWLLAVIYDKGKTGATINYREYTREIIQLAKAEGVCPECGDWGTLPAGTLDKPEPDVPCPEEHGHRWENGETYNHAHKRGNTPHGHHGSKYVAKCQGTGKKPIKAKFEPYGQYDEQDNDLSQGASASVNRLDIPKVLFHKVVHQPEQDIVASIKAKGILPQIASAYKDLVPESICDKPVIWLASKLHSYIDAPVFLIETDTLDLDNLHHVEDADLDWWIYKGSIPADQIIALLPDEEAIRKATRWEVGEELCILIGNKMLEDTKAGELLGEQLRDYMNHYLKDSGQQGE